MADLKAQAAALVRYVTKAVNNTYHFGNLTSSIYDTAWVSLVRKKNDPNEDLLFPECFQYVLETQLQDGGWKIDDSEIDGIMNTLGGLLALKKNADTKHHNISEYHMQLRVDNAVKYVKRKLQTWDVATCDYVGFEIIIPAMLELIEGEGLTLDFPGRQLLTELNQKKLAKIPPSIWSGKVQTTITHSLEAFVGKVDFTGLRDQRICGGMSASPASTAAYLMNVPEWDEEAEDYLQKVISSRPNRGYSGVPGMYPTTGFEVLWIASTLLENGFSEDELPGIHSVLGVIDEFHEALGGFASGFSKSSVPDADDTSKSLLTQKLLGKTFHAKRLVEKFEGKEHFLTYMMERHPSVTTNCNVLSALLEAEDAAQYMPQVEKVARYLCASWSRTDVPFADKWNISEFYPIMLLSEALIRLLRKWDDGGVPATPADLFETVSLTLFEVLMKTLQKQNQDGSWGVVPSREITGYAIISLANLASLPFLGELGEQINLAIEDGRRFLLTTEDSAGIEYNWIAKTSYSPLEISKAYVLAGLKVDSPKFRLSQKLSKQVDISQKGLVQYSKLFSKLPCLVNTPSWRIRGSIMEGYLLLKELNRIRHDIFERTNMKKDDYFEFIAMVFSCANNLQGSFLRSDVLFAMMTLVLRVYQVDEFMEHVVGRQCATSINTIKKFVEALFSDNVSNGNGHASNGVNGTNGIENGHTNGSTPSNGTKVSDDQDLAQVYDRLKALVNSIVHHPLVITAGAYDQHLLKLDIRSCLLSHIAQIEDSKWFYASAHRSTEAGRLKYLPQGSFYSWVHTTAAEHSCAPLTLSFLGCLLSNDSSRASPSAEERYIVQDICIHLSVKARMENDRASITRDRKEENLNSLDFSEFNSGTNSALEDAKGQLTRVVEFEKKAIEMGLERLRQVARNKSGEELVNALEFYYFLTDIYGDVYAMRDISCER